MLVKTNMDIGSESLPWNPGSWAPFIDAAISVGSSILFGAVTMRIVSGINEVIFISNDAPPNMGYLFVEHKSLGETLQADIKTLAEDGTCLCQLKGMKFSEIDGINMKSPGIESLLYRMAWVPASFSETPLPLKNAVVISAKSSTSKTYVKDLKPLTHRVTSLSSYKELKDYSVVGILAQSDAVVIYVPGAEKKGGVARRAHAFVWEAASILSVLSKIRSNPKLFIILDSAYKGQCLDRAAQYSLYGFSRVAASEYPDTWGGLIDNEGTALPLSSIRYLRMQSVVRVQDGVPQVARLRPFCANEKATTSSGRSLLPQPHGTYLVTGGFGDLGLEVLQFLVESGARRIVIVSRRTLPPRKEWPSVSGPMATIIERIKSLEDRGATIHALALDIGIPGISAKLTGAVERLSLPPVLGIVHAAAVSGYGYIKDMSSNAYASVMAPKITGALNLHEAFPPRTLGFFILFSSIGQLIGTPGQSAYAASNAFLDGLAIHRRAQGCDTVAIQWTAWRAMGLASNTTLIDPELYIAGIADITAEEGFQAWQHLSTIDTDHAVVTRLRILEADEPMPCELVADVVKRRAAKFSLGPPSSVEAVKSLTGSELKLHLEVKIRNCLAAILHLDVEEIVSQVAVSELGVDSIMNFALRPRLQETLLVAVPPTLTWSHPTVEHLVEWFYLQLGNM